MKIVYLSSDYGKVSETFIVDLVQGLSQKNVQLSVICNKNHSSLSPADVEFQVYQIPFMVLTEPWERLQLKMTHLGLLRHTPMHFHVNHAYRYLLPKFKELSPDVVYIDFGTVSAVVCKVLKALEIPFVVHFHGSDISSALSDAAYRDSLDQVFRSASALIVASNHIRRLLILEGASQDKIHLIKLGINLEDVAPNTWYQRQCSEPSIVFLGRFTPKKHPVALIQAFALVKQRVPDARLVMIGDGPEMPRVQQRIQQLGLQQAVNLHGTLPRDEALSIVNNHWVFAQHSVTALSGDQEGFGISLAEAAALGLPVVSTLHNGIPEQVIHGETGFLVREFDYETMADYLVKLLLDPDLAAKLGQTGSKHVQELFQTHNRVQQIKDLLVEICI